MRVAMYYNNNDVRLEEMPVPDIACGELLIKVMAAGICGSDVLEWYRIKTAPRVLGHEITGDVVRVGEGVKYKEGDRIFATHHVPCNTCKYCLSGHHTACDTLHKTSFFPGGFSEYLRIPSINVDRGVQRLPDEMSYEEGTFIEPLGCVLRGQRLAGVSAGLTVLVLGSGITGLLHIQAAKAQGATRVLATDVNDYRLNAAKRFGADQTIRANDDVPLRTKEFNHGVLADVVIVCAGAISAIRQALDSVDKGGTVLLFATPPIGDKFPVDFASLWRKEIKLQTTYAAAPQDLKIALDLLEKKKVNVQSMITHRLPLEETGRGFKIVADAKESIKVIIEPQK
jgi:L-iditol 2-dehydrogenase